MKALADALAELGDALAETVMAAGDDLRVVDDAEVLTVLAAAGRLRRQTEAVMIEAVAQLLDRDEAAPHPERVTTRYGCRNTNELVQRATRASSRTSADVVAAAKATRCRLSLSTGDVLPAEFPRMRDALVAGHVGLDGVIAVAGVLSGCSAGRAELLAADEELAAASGLATDGTPPASADELRAQAHVWAAYLDQDGAEPAESRALRKRGVTLGRCRDGLIPIRGNLLPEVAAQFETACDSVLNPRVDGAPGPGPRFVDSDAAPGGDAESPIEAAADPRTAAQKRHDALAVLLTAAAASGDLPMLGGAAPTLVVQVREEDLINGRGYAHLPGRDEPISIAAARHVACAGVIERVLLGENGRIVSLGTLERVFNHHQRRAITLRDGGCVVPGCHVPPQWCEIHHVEEHSRGGPTHTDNGALLCWFHHRTIDNGGWEIRMVAGIPHIRGPYWWDAARRWRPAGRSPTRRSDRLAHRGSG
ncbi:HNH endonuclease signature motif containing protein [Microbacterium timonense]|uniref:HNH endonuclease signature motif containing protein n=1 Tax=Microbacterium timonense TaxID=2086576 RepID=UPI000D0E62DE|nr:HNH endonuclease signature motif containing protein [Microbacterium timonense]